MRIYQGLGVNEIRQISRALCLASSPYFRNRSSQLPCLKGSADISILLPQVGSIVAHNKRDAISVQQMVSLFKKRKTGKCNCVIGGTAALQQQFSNHHQRHHHHHHCHHHRHHCYLQPHRPHTHAVRHPRLSINDVKGRSVIMASMFTPHVFCYGCRFGGGIPLMRLLS